jgi:hypothetical protein
MWLVFSGRPYGMAGLDGIAMAGGRTRGKVPRVPRLPRARKGPGRALAPKFPAKAAGYKRRHARFPRTAEEERQDARWVAADEVIRVVAEGAAKEEEDAEQMEGDVGGGYEAADGWYEAAEEVPDPTAEEEAEAIHHADEEEERTRARAARTDRRRVDAEERRRKAAVGPPSW